MSKYEDLVNKLKEIFQIDKPELDFGVYRILNARVVEINDYLENRLKAKVQESLAMAGSANTEHLQKELSDAEKSAQALGLSADQVSNMPKVLELRQKIAESSTGASEHENAVFTHLLTFFSRYYDSGDFISQRRYKGDTYAIPYAGEEVMLHWANKDQYYTKSGENFSNYAFKLDDGRTVRFRLIAADTAKDNRKDSDKERRFVLIEPHTQTFSDDGDEYEETLLPVEELDGELVIRFEYKVMAKGTKQEDQITKALKTVLEDEAVKAKWLDLSKREPTEGNPQRTLLEKCLVNYTSKNTADYFIHKDLSRFLSGELDFYIKNEVMHLDDIQNAEKFSDIEKNLRQIQTLRSIAIDLITFLSQLEEFQKKLWLKKKFVVDSYYCITLDRVPETLYQAIGSNELQWNQWQALGMLEGDKIDLFNQVKSGNLEYLRSHSYLMIDTSLFDNSFKYKVLADIESLDESLDGILIQGDNFQALNLLQERHRQGIDGIYIDPPYNTDASEIIYKNGYKDSSWCSLISDRLRLSSQLIKKDAPVCVTIDECEVSNLQNVIETNLDGYKVRPVIIEYNHRGRVKSNFAITHEYALWALPVGKDVITRKKEFSEDIKRNLRRTGTDSTRQASPSQFFGIEVDNDTLKIVAVSTALPIDAAIPEHANSTTTMVWPIDDQGIERRWYYGKDRVALEAKEGVTVWAKRIKGEIQIHYHQAGKPKMRKSVWVGKLLDASTYGSEYLNDLFGLSNSGFSFPKSIHAVYECLESMTYDKNATFLDFFAGSGTTGHAVIKLNRDDNGSRKYIMVEQGEYFDTVTKPRIQKAVYSANWKNGVATGSETGISHMFKVLRIESYEDTLNNLQLHRTEVQQDMLKSMSHAAKDNYLLSYMLDIESRNSLLSVQHFNSPFDFKLKVAIDSAGASEERNIDLLETFNYLIGLRIKHIDMQVDKGFVTITGWLPSGEKTLVLWRDVEQVDYEALNKLCEKLAINPADSEFDVVYINGDHNIPAVFTNTEAEGGVTKTLKLRQIEPEFLSRMFAVDVV